MTAAPSFQILGADGLIDRHRHRSAYVALVLSGGYSETGDRGRFEARPGQVVIHGPWEAHRNAVSKSGAIILNLPITIDIDFGAGLCSDPDAIARAAESDAAEAVARLVLTVTPVAQPPRDWPDILACALRRNPGLSLTHWAREASLDPSTVSRGFTQAYGVNPRRYRAEQRALRAIRLIHRRDESLAAIAVETGFVDQAHMTRIVASMTGLTPARLRSSRYNTRA